VRVNRSAIIRIAAVRELLPWTPREYKIMLRDGTELMGRGFLSHPGDENFPIIRNLADDNPPPVWV